jgi:transcriptional regulator with XRE-family HTH domain
MDAKRLNQVEFGELIGADRHMVNKWLRHKKRPSLQTLLKISSATGIKLEKLVKSL